MGRADINRVCQIGKETTAGVAVAGSKRLLSLAFEMNVDIKDRPVNTQGIKYPTDVIVDSVMGVGSFSGPLSFSEILYPLAMLYGLPAPTTPGGATNARQWEITPNPVGADPFKTFTVEEGDGDAATITTNVVATSLNIEFGEPEVNVSGDLIGRAPTTGTLTGSPTSHTKNLVTARHLDVYVGTSLGTLFQSGQKITDAVKESFKIGNKSKERFVHNTDYISFKEVIELRPEIEFMFSTEHNAQSRALYDACVAGAFRYVGIQATGPEIESGQDNLIQLTMAAKIVPEKREDIDGIFAFGYKVMPIYDATLGSSHKWKIVNDVTAI